MKSGLRGSQSWADTALAMQPVPCVEFAFDGAPSMLADSGGCHCAPILRFKALPRSLRSAARCVDHRATINGRDFTALDKYCAVYHHEINVGCMRVVDKILNGIEHRLETECSEVEHNQVRSLARLERPYFALHAHCPRTSYRSHLEGLIRSERDRIFR